MPDKKYQIFISSTYKDLINQRLEVAKSILDLGHIPAAMEYFPAMDEDQLRYIKRVIDQCDYYVLIIGGKYGSVDKEGISYTEREYEYAIERKKFVLGFPFKNIEHLLKDKTESDPDLIKKLANFRSKVMAGRLVRAWESEQELILHVTKALAIAFTEFPQEGWVRSPKNSHESLLEEINELRKDNYNFKNENENLKLHLSRIESINAEIFNDIEPLQSKHNFEIGISGETKMIEMTWESIFMKISSIVESNMYRRVKLGDLREAFIADLAPQKAGSRQSIDLGIFNIILNQLRAHNLLKVENSQAILTEKGEKFYLSNIAIRKSK